MSKTADRVVHLQDVYGQMVVVPLDTIIQLTRQHSHLQVAMVCGMDIPTIIRLRAEYFARHGKFPEEDGVVPPV